ncbi:MAG: LysR substrate-binding domain-containing protein [Kiloniellales bacterium]|nr:LysR substrate-binding domain-containing protein [Kiloniellales bacterium]
MRFKSYDSLRLFDVVARRLSFTAAAEELNLTKGAVSYQVNRLERDLGFPVFTRRHRGIALTEKGKRLWHASQVAFRDLDREITGLREEAPGRITIGLSTYFASRWLSPRLMTFMAEHTGIGLRLQPLVDLIDLRTQNIDMAIRWGKGDWRDLEIEPLFPCPAFPSAGAAIATRIAEAGLEAALPGLPLLHDHDDSEAWRDWHTAAGLPYRTTRDDLVIPDPNVRVQAVIDGQGLALNDALIASELDAGQLHRISEVELGDYGYYLAYPRGALETPGLRAFRDWMILEAGTG